MMYSAIGWFEMVEIKTIRSKVIDKVIEQTLLNRYPWPTEIILGRGREFLAEFSDIFQKLDLTKELENLEKSS